MKKASGMLCPHSSNSHSQEALFKMLIVDMESYLCEMGIWKKKLEGRCERSQGQEEVLRNGWNR